MTSASHQTVVVGHRDGGQHISAIAALDDGWLNEDRYHVDRKKDQTNEGRR